MGAVVEFRLAGDGLGIELPVFVDLDLGIEPAHAVMAHFTLGQGAEAVGRRMQLAIGIDEAYARTLAQFPVQAEDAKVSIGAGKRIAGKYGLARSPVVGKEGA